MPVASAFTGQPGLSSESPASTSQFLGSSVLFCLTGGRISKSHSRPLVGRSALTPELRLMNGCIVQHLNALPSKRVHRVRRWYTEHTYDRHMTCPSLSHHSPFRPHQHPPPLSAKTPLATALADMVTWSSYGHRMVIVWSSYGHRMVIVWSFVHMRPRCLNGFQWSTVHTVPYRLISD